MNIQVRKTDLLQDALGELLDETEPAASIEISTDIEDKKNIVRKSRVLLSNSNAKRKFRDSWAEEFHWLCNENGQAYCTACQKFVLNHYSHIKRHGEKLIHLKKMHNNPNPQPHKFLVKHPPKFEDHEELSGSTSLVNPLHEEIITQSTISQEAPQPALTEFDLFCKAVALQLNQMNLEDALICQEKLQSVLTEYRLNLLHRQREQGYV